MKANKRRILAAAGQLANDADLCTMFNLTPAALEPLRQEIDAQRTAARVHLEWERMKARANGKKV